MLKFRSKGSNPEDSQPVNTVIGIGSNFRGTLMVSGTLRIEGEFEGDILNCERLEIGEHGVMRADIEVREALVQGRVDGNIRALGVLEMKIRRARRGRHRRDERHDGAGRSFTGRCTMLETGSEAVEFGMDSGRLRETIRS